MGIKEKRKNQKKLNTKFMYNLNHNRRFRIEPEGFSAHRKQLNKALLCPVGVYTFICRSLFSQRAGALGDAQNILNLVWEEPCVACLGHLYLLHKADHLKTHSSPMNLCVSLLVK